MQKESKIKSLFYKFTKMQNMRQKSKISDKISKNREILEIKAIKKQ